MDSGATSLGGYGLALIPAHEADAGEVLRFEVDNRAYFRSWIPDRGDDYFDLDAVTASLERAHGWWLEGTDRLHVVIDSTGRVRARANLTDIRKQRAELGYRVAHDEVGRGVATAAVTELLDRAPRWDIHTVYATTTVGNTGSARVLERCGFTVTRQRTLALTLDDTVHDAVDWVRKL